MFWGQTERRRHKVLKLSFSKMRKRQNFKCRCSSKETSRTVKCWTWIWLSCWIQAWIWMGDLSPENNMKWKTLPYNPPCSNFISYCLLASKPRTSLPLFLLTPLLLRCCLLCPLYLRSFHFLFWSSSTYFMHLKICPLRITSWIAYKKQSEERDKCGFN